MKIRCVLPGVTGRPQTPKTSVSETSFCHNCISADLYPFHGFVGAKKWGAKKYGQELPPDSGLGCQRFSDAKMGGNLCRGRRNVAIRIIRKIRGASEFVRSVSHPRESRKVGDLGTSSLKRNAGYAPARRFQPCEIHAACCGNEPAASVGGTDYRLLYICTVFCQVSFFAGGIFSQLRDSCRVELSLLLVARFSVVGPPSNFQSA